MGEFVVGVLFFWAVGVLVIHSRQRVAHELNGVILSAPRWRWVVRRRSMTAELRRLAS